MEPWEVMISESQERMIAIVRPQMLEAVEAVLDRWELEHAVVGEVTATGRLRAFWHDEVVGEIPARLLTDECPRYEVGQMRRAATPAREVVAAPSAHDALVELLATPRSGVVASCFPPLRPARGSRTVRRPGPRPRRDPVRPSVRGSPSRSTDRTHRSPGSVRCVRSRARGGAQRRVRRWRADRFPDASTFGNPEKPEIGWELAQAIDGIAAAAEASCAPRRLRERVALQRDERRSIHPTPLSGRSASSRTCVACRRPVRGDVLLRGLRVAGVARGLGVPGPLRRGRRHAGAARPRCRGPLISFPLASAPRRDADARRVRGRPRRVPPERRSSRARSHARPARRSGRSVRRGGRAGDCRVRAGDASELESVAAGLGVPLRRVRRAAAVPCWEWSSSACEARGSEQ